MTLTIALVVTLIAAVLAAASGWLGGLGGARATRRRLRELEDDVEQLDRRVSRREGAAGREKRQVVDDALAADVAKLVRASPASAAAVLSAGGNGAAPATRNEVLARARRARGAVEREE